MITVNLWDSEFSHSLQEQGFDAAAYRIQPKKIRYVRNQKEWEGITLFTNRQLEQVKSVKTTIKVAWMIEARAILPQSYSDLDRLENEFDYVLTYYEDLLQRNPQKYKRFIMGCCRIPEEERKIYAKTKILSHLVTRQYSTEAHRFRHTLADFLTQTSFPVTIFGPNHTPYPTKLDAHKEFMFSIIIMNSSENFFITEWVIDCFLCGTIPIFYGCPAIGNFFNPNGILQVQEFNDLLSILPTLTPELYYSKLAAVYENFETAKAYDCPDDMVADILLKIPV
ncbi:MAG: hypothetical protein ACKOPU_04640 [Candidatus Planktophila sp.]